MIPVIFISLAVCAVITCMAILAKALELYIKAYGMIVRRSFDGRIEPYSRWRHYKGGEYIALGVGRHSETKEPMVVYTHDGEIWARPLAMWFDKVDGGRCRFERI